MTTLQKIIKYAALAFAIFLIVSILTGIVGAVAGVTGLLDRKSLAGENKVYQLDQDLQGLSIDIRAGALEIRTSDYFGLESNHRYLEVRNDNGTLKIQETKQSVHNVDYSDVQILLTIPAGYHFSHADITTGAGTVDIAELMCSTLDMELGAGAVTIGTLQASKVADIETGAGKMTIANCAIQNLDLEMGVGEMNLTGSLAGSCNLELGIGKTVLALEGSQEAYTISFEKGLGEASLEGKSLQNGTYGSGENKLEIHGGIGAIEITFE